MKNNLTPEEIIEGNILIAKFMGLTQGKRLGLWSDDHPTILTYHEEGVSVKGTCETKDLGYRGNWQWLMPVVEKIASLNPKEGKEWYYYNISHCHCRIYANTSFGISWECSKNSNTTNSAIWLAVVEFLKWFNAQNK